MERDLRKRAVALHRCLQAKGITMKETASLIGMKPTCIQAWRRAWWRNRLAPLVRGRPAHRSSLETRTAILQTFHDLGPQTGMPTLEGLFPEVPRRELENLLWRYRGHLIATSPLAYELAWLKPGTVWAIDYTDPPSPIDGLYKDILVVRDLASGKELASLPVPIETGQATADALASLFIQHAAPLLIKRDNGGTLTAAPVRELLWSSGVQVLASPVKTPEYNGSCEAGNGAIKTRAHHVASRNGRPGHWTCDDIEEARGLTNSTARPKGPAGPTPNELWAGRRPITQNERISFDNAVRSFFNEGVAARKRIRQTSGDPKDGDADATLERRAIRQALVSGGYLLFRRRRIPQPKNLRQA